jgi:ferrochelatase
MNKKNIIVVLFNIGGPNKISEVKKYLMNFFSDKYIIRLPFLLRKFIAFMISRTRYKKTTAIYNSIGGFSPIFPNTKAQADLLEQKLNEKNDNVQYKVYISMRYWHPMSDEIIKNIELNKNYDQIILLPLYPQCSSTTTVSAYENWTKIVKKISKNSEDFLKKTKLICNHYNHEKFIEAYYDLILTEAQKAKTQAKQSNLKYKLFFSAHSIPEFLVTELGDPYKDQIIKTVEKIVEKLKKNFDEKLEYIITYQSKVGKLKWLEPKTEDELLIAAKNQIIPIVIPIAFVSENSETLFELDIDYKDLIRENGMKYFFRSPTVSCNEKYIECLINSIENAIQSNSNFPTKRLENENDFKNGCLKTDCPCIKYSLNNNK